MSVPESLRFTYEDYLLLPEDRRYEIVDGDLFLTPAPTPYHQTVAKRLGFLLDAYVQERKLGEVFIAPCDVVLSRFDVLQPDVFFISAARLSIIGEKYISDAPDLVVEVLSPSTADRDQVAKARQYAKFGVVEMWIVDPKARSAEIFRNSPEGFHREAVYAAADVLRSPALPGLEIALDRVF
ncbi:MAG TPA: Uma2 family endonuclease [Thermoanaerobaculia bacterium]|nr:Uma2 family endonuclease [Thermoanaerobaculia bacterium]